MCPTAGDKVSKIVLTCEFVCLVLGLGIHTHSQSSACVYHSTKRREILEADAYTFVATCFDTPIPSLLDFAIKKTPSKHMQKKCGGNDEVPVSKLYMHPGRVIKLIVSGKTA